MVIQQSYRHTGAKPTLVFPFSLFEWKYSSKKKKKKEPSQEDSLGVRSYSINTIIIIYKFIKYKIINFDRPSHS